MYTLYIDKRHKSLYNKVQKNCARDMVNKKPMVDCTLPQLVLE